MRHNPARDLIGDPDITPEEIAAFEERCFQAFLREVEDILQSQRFNVGIKVMTDFDFRSAYDEGMSIYEAAQSSFNWLQDQRTLDGQ